MAKKTKLVFQIILVVSFIFCLLSGVLYFVIKYTLPEKLIENNFNIGVLDRVEDPNEKNIFNIRYYSNKDNSGIELFEIKLNSYMNVETAKTEDPAVYSYGYQVVGTSQNSIRYVHYSEEAEANITKVVNNLRVSTLSCFNGNNNIYHYNTQNGVSFASTTLNEEENIFKISLDNEIYGLKFKCVQRDDVVNVRDYFFFKGYDYFIYDMNYLASELYYNVKSMNNGLDGLVTIKIPHNVFDFYKFENGVFNEISKIDNASLVTQIVDTFITCKVEIFDTGAKVAEDSMFNIIQKQSDYSIIEEDSVYDYKIGNAPVLLTEYDFEYKLVEGSYNTYKVLLRESTIEYLRTTSTDIKITLNCQNLKDNNIQLYGFDTNSGLAEFKDRISSIVINQYGIEKGVSYDTEQFV